MFAVILALPLIVLSGHLFPSFLFLKRVYQKEGQFLHYAPFKERCFMTRSSIEAEKEQPLHLAPDILILHLIATGVIRLSVQITKGKTIDSDYPIPLQRGLDRLNVIRYRHNLPLVQSIPDLLLWCQRPLNEWPLDFQAAQLDPDDTLLAGQFTTDVCQTLARATNDVEADIIEQHFMNGVFEVCRGANSPQAYVDFRRMLIERPALTELELLQWRSQYPSLDILKEHINEAYEHAPLHYMVKGYFSCCPLCGNLRQPTMTQDRFFCEDERCRRVIETKQVLQNERRLSAREHVYWLKWGLRRFITMPGRAEIRLEQRLREKGLKVEMWPEFDRYDLRVVFPDGEAWLVDVKDWANAYLLGCHVRGISSSLEWKRAYYVFPKERKDECSDYVTTFINTCKSDKGHVQITGRVRAAFEGDFLRDVSRRLQGGRDAR